MFNKQVRNALWFCLAAIFFLGFNGSVNACEQLSFEEPWVREPPPVSPVAAAYVTIKNHNDHAISISELASSCCKHVMVHETVVENGKARMVHLDKLTIDANAESILAPLGTHMMLMGLQQGLSDGNSVGVTFTCGPDDKTSVTFPVIKQ